LGLADLHIHTIYSYDATSSVSGVLKYAADHAQLDVVAITDHDKIDGALEALELAPSYNVDVIPGIEVTTAEGHLLTLFVTKDIPAGLSLEKTVLKAVELGGVCIVPHPMMNSRMGVSPHTIRRALHNPDVAKGLVGVEVFNAGLAGAQRDLAAQSLCYRLPVARVGNSDAHFDWMIGLGATGFPGRSAADLRRALENRQTYAVGKRQMNVGDFVVRYLPRLILRYAGWVTWNVAPSEPLRLARLSK